MHTYCLDWKRVIIIVVVFNFYQFKYNNNIVQMGMEEGGGGRTRMSIFYRGRRCLPIQGRKVKPGLCWPHGKGTTESELEWRLQFGFL
jgi:hypothetical protein